MADTGRTGTHGSQERRRQEEVAARRPLRERELQTLADNSPDVMGRVDRHLRYLFISRAITAITGRRVEEYLGKTNEEVGSPAKLCELWSAHFREVFRTGRPRDLEFSLSSPDGQRHFSMRAVPELAADGSIETVAFVTRDVTELRRAEESRQRHATLVDGINRIFRDALRVTSTEWLGDVCLDVAQTVTQSTEAFVGEVNPSTGLLERMAASSLELEVGDVCTEDQSRGTPRKMEIPDIYARVIREGQGCFVNSLSKRSQGMDAPDGHLPLQSVLAVPLTRDGHAVGILAVGNRPGGYREEQQETLKVLATAIVEALDRRRAEATLREAQQLSAALNRINARIHARLEPVGILHDLVAEGAKALGCETAALSVRGADGWIVRHVHDLPSDLLGTVMSDDEQRHAWLALHARQPVAIEDAWSDDRVDVNHMRRHNIRAVLVVPLIVRNRPFGALFFNYHSRPHAFTKVQMVFAKQLAVTASISLENVRLFEQHRKAERELKRLNEALEALVKKRTAVAEERAEGLRRLAAELSEAEHRERKRLAKLLHDDLQQLLLAVKLRLPALLEGDQNQLEQHVEKLDQLVSDCMSTSRDLSHELSPTVLHQGTLAEVIQWVAEWFRDKHRLAISLDIDRNLPGVPEHVRIFLFESVRELLFNVVKHSGKMEAGLRLSLLPRSLALQVEDAGDGFDPESIEASLQHPEGFGLFNIRERLEALGGRLEIQATPRGGGCFRLLLPLTGDPETLREGGARNEVEADVAQPEESHGKARKTRLVAAETLRYGRE